MKPRMIPGAVWGAYTILGFSEQIYQAMSNGVLRNFCKLVARCNRCGATHHLTRAVVSQSKCNERTCCAACCDTWLPDTAPMAPHRVEHTTTRWCQECFGQSWRRPRVGTCRCGEAHSPEQFGPAEMYRGECAIVRCEAS